MPELPEVETIRRGLKDCLVREKGGKILKVEVLAPNSFIGEPGEIVGTEVLGLKRRGKALIFDFSKDRSMIVHLRMTGQLVWVGVEKFAGGHPSDAMITVPNKQTRVIVKFEKGALYFNDQRKFGFMKVVPTKEVEKDAFIKKLAKEPWEITGEELYEKLQRHKGAPIKSVLLDQAIIAGIGNIYADEALFYAKVNPKRKAGLVSEGEAKKLVEGARKVMDKSLAAGGSTLRNYIKSDGSKGDYLELFAEVFNRQGQKCRRCGAEIVKTKVGGRGTHYCPKCQKI